jgi:hypothetical protein
MLAFGVCAPQKCALSPTIRGKLQTIMIFWPNGLEKFIRTHHSQSINAAKLLTRDEARRIATEILAIAE